MSTLKVPVTTADHILGNINAPYTLLEYGDYECSYCALAYPIVKEVYEHFGNQLRFVYRNFPLSNIHPYAEAASETAEFAAEYGKFWEMYDLIYENNDSLSKFLLLELATNLDLPVVKLEEALEKKLYDLHSGIISGVNGTPTFFINGSRYDGANNFEELVEAIEVSL
jgi:protein-disulfide isomerase